MEPNVPSRAQRAPPAHCRSEEKGVPTYTKNFPDKFQANTQICTSPDSDKMGEMSRMKTIKLGLSGIMLFALIFTGYYTGWLLQWDLQEVKGKNVSKLNIKIILMSIT